MAKKPADRPELSSDDVQERVWSRPGGEELALREAKTGAEADVDGQSEAVEQETPAENIRRISDPTLDPADTAKKG